MAGENLMQMEQLRKLEEMKKRLLGNILTKEALERLSRVRMVNPELSGQVELYLLQIYQAGKLDGRVTDIKLREIFRVLTKDQRKGKITRK
jgi:DNA-binding TFAR19-related protein (PDSD5 family)